MNKNLPPYTIVKKTRSRRIRLQVSAGGKVKVTAPARASDSLIESFLAQHSQWILSKVEYFKKIPEQTLSKNQDKKLYAEYKQKTLILAESKVKQWNNHYNLPFKKIAIRNSKSRWGSCSSSGTISFNYKIVFVPEPLADYLVVHELCHVKEPNHGQTFWSLVAETIPDYKEKREALRNFEKTFMHLNTSANTNILMDTNIRKPNENF